MRENPSGSDVTPITEAFGKIPGSPSGSYGYPWFAAYASAWYKIAALKPNTDYPHAASTIAWYN
ncbi:hypothetical protein [Nonomuraea dietziae]|uniref:Uncharacterized protein n=2 Tax=Nonomuraea dietziae TaxID=65515 RepID=A0A7W5Y527_9ACTN|nr:hypothetical protein [Nonomuraea dietziae]MBB3724821.1 hypothetical protein [Nonomuraea dietziae]